VTARRHPLGLRPAPVPEGFPGRADFVKSATRLAEAPHLPLPEVCFCGRSNVGKSTLLNTLCNRKQLARVSSTPGRTRLLNFFNVQDTVAFVDLPGYGWARAPKSMQAEWGTTIQTYLADRPQLVLSLLLVDSRRDPGDDERNLLAWFQATGRPCLVVATKADKIANSRRPARNKAIAQALGLATADVVPFAAPTREGRDVLWGLILASVAAAESAAAPAGPPVPTTPSDEA